MQTVRFGKTGLQASRLGFGCVSFGVRHLKMGWDPYTETGAVLVKRSVHAALDAGINFFDTSPDYGDGHSERLLGAALASRRADAIIATKVHYGGAKPEEIEHSVIESLLRLGTDYIDIIQFHGGNYPPKSNQRILEGGLLDMLVKLRERGLVRYIGLTVTDPVTARTLIESGAFDSIQLMYSLIEQAAARHALDWAKEQDLGTTVMRPLAAGTLERQLAAIAPEWSAARSPHEVCLRFALSDSRVHVVNVGMRWEHEVQNNVASVNAYTPAIDLAGLPRSVGKVAKFDDKEGGNNNYLSA